MLEINESNLSDMKYYLDGVIGIAEANSYEKMSLWRELHEDHGVPWEYGCSGYLVQVGKTYGRDVWMDLYVETIAGYKVAFYSPTSVVVDYELIEKWFKIALPETAFKQASEKFINMSDSMNFHNIFPYGTFSKYYRK